MAMSATYKADAMKYIFNIRKMWLTRLHVISHINATSALNIRVSLKRKSLIMAHVQSKTPYDYKHQLWILIMNEHLWTPRRLLKLWTLRHK